MINAIQLLKNNIEIRRDDIFISDDSIQHTYSETIEIASQYFSFFGEIGLKKGDKVVVISENSLSLALLYIACMGYGITVVPLSSDYKINQIKQFIDFIKPRTIFISKNNDKLKSFNFFKNSFIFDNYIFYKNEIVYDINNYSPKKDLFLTGIGAKDQLIIIFTSGTTSMPKGVVHSYESIILNALAFGDIFNLGTTHRFINYLPMTYLGGYYNLLMLPFINSCQVYISEKINPLILTNFWSLIYKNNINSIWFVPSIISMILKIDRGFKDHITKETSMLCFVGTAPLSSELKARFEEKYRLKLYENYGLSETLFISTQTPNEVTNITNVGKLLSGINVRINKFSEIEVETPYLMQGYNTSDGVLNEYNNQYFKTGDIGVLDSRYNDILSIMDRKKDIIIRGGININPILIENLIYSNKHVLECSVVGIQSEFTGEDIISYLTLNTEQKHTDVIDEIRQYLEDNLAKYQLPDRYIIIEDFPKTVSGKINKNKLVEIFNASQNT